MDEFLALAYHQERALDCVIARLFNTVGPRQSGQYGMVVPRFIQNALAGRPLEIHGDGTQTRCFCHVADVVRALADLMTEAKPWGEVVNIGSTEEISMLALADRVKQLTASESEIVTVPYEEAYGEGFEDMRRRVPDLSKADALIAWHPERDLDTILRDVIASRARRGDSGLSIAVA
jgi:UDP-glucose 4-epimerase